MSTAAFAGISEVVLKADNTSSAGEFSKLYAVDGKGSCNGVYATLNDAHACVYSDISGLSITAISSVPTKSGYYFTGFYDSNGEQFINASGSIRTVFYKYLYFLVNETETNLITLFPQWAHRVTFEKDGGDGGTSYLYAKNNAIYTDQDCSNVWTAEDPIEVPTRSEYHFEGYYYDGTKIFDETGKYVAPANMLSAAQSYNLTLTALWRGQSQVIPKEITIRWYGVKTVPSDSGFSAVSNGIATSTVLLNGDIITPVEPVSSAGQTFLGWKFVND